MMSPALSSQPGNHLDALLVCVSPSSPQNSSSSFSPRNQNTPDIGAGYLLSAAGASGLSVGFLDSTRLGSAPALAEVCKIVERQKPAVIGFSAYTNGIRTAARIASAVKDLYGNIVTVVGGPHATALPGRTLEEFQSFDYAICGEGERALVEICREVRSGAIDSVPGVVARGGSSRQGIPISSLDDLPFPLWGAFGLDRYTSNVPHRQRRTLPLLASRGCPYHCSFCSKVLGSMVRRRSVQSVIDELICDVERYRCSSIEFLDETFTLDNEWVTGLCSAIMKESMLRTVSWSCGTRVDLVSLDMLRLMREAGCEYIFFGFESADDHVLSLNKGGSASVDRIRIAVESCKQCGIVPAGSFIIGLPGDTGHSAMQAIALARELDLFSVGFPVAIPFPGTRIRDMAIRSEHGLRLLSDNWDDYDQQGGPVLDSVDFSWDHRKDMQRLAYRECPTGAINDYRHRMRAMGFPYDHAL